VHVPHRRWARARGGVYRPARGGTTPAILNPRSDTVETPEQIVTKVEAALRTVPAERVFLNPDCGFGTFSARPVNDAAIAERKLAAMAEAARRLRGS
jgi:5-methyltetrahydropteroyltriglutamate--homocysteine methyltransferase